MSFFIFEIGQKKGPKGQKVLPTEEGGREERLGEGCFWEVREVVLGRSRRGREGVRWSCFWGCFFFWRERRGRVFWEGWGGLFFGFREVVLGLGLFGF